MAVFVVAAMAMVSTAEAQDAGGGDPNLDAGWVLQNAEEGDATVAGTPALGYVAFFDGNRGWFSTDGVDWQSISFPVEAGDFSVRDIAAGPLGFVAVLTSPSTGFPKSLAFSPDGSSWTVINGDDLQEFPSDGVLREVEAGPNGFVVTGDARSVDAAEDDATPVSCFAWFSPDGRSWSRANLPEECFFVRVAAHLGGWVALLDSAGAPSFSSDNGIEWTERNATTALEGLGPTVSYSGVLAMVNVAPFRISLSDDDASSWETRPIDASAGLVGDLIANDLGFVCSYFDESETGLVPGGLLFSADGATWVTYPVDIVLVDIAAAADSLVAVGPAGIYTWTPPGSELLPGTATPEPLANTGTNPLTLIGIAVGFLTAGAALLLTRRQIRLTSRS